MSLFDRAKQFISGSNGGSSDSLDSDVDVSPEHQAILKRLRSRYDYAAKEWRDQRTRMKEDLRLMANDPFTEIEKRERGGKRPLVVTDHLGQFTSQIVNDVRRNKRGVNMMPKSILQNPAEAVRRGNIARGIEQESDAQSAYWTMYEGAVTCGMGNAKLTRDYESVNSDHQVLRIERISNPLSILHDPDVKRIDFGDMRFCFELSSLPYREFGSEYPDAKMTDFSGTEGDRLKRDHPSWIRSDDMQIAAYWEVQKRGDTLLIMQSQNMRIEELLKKTPEAQWRPNSKNPKDGGWIEAPGIQPVKVIKWRKVEVSSVWRYQTNGVEILDEYMWEDDSDSIPIYPTVGREQWVDITSSTGSTGGGNSSSATMRRFYVSAVHYTAWAVKGMAYVRSLQTELAQVTSKTPIMAIAGQLDGMKGWSTLNTDPNAWVYYRAKLKEFGETVLPPPQRLNVTNQELIMALEQLYQSFSEDVQQAMGMYRASVGNQSGSTSGKMVQELDEQSDQGQYHFVSNLNATLLRMWKDINRQMDKIYDLARDVTGVRPDGTAEPMRLNDPSAGDRGYQMGQGEFAVSLSIGPADESEIETGKKGIEAMVAANPGMLDPNNPWSIGDLVPKVMGKGPIFDEISRRMKPLALQNSEDPQNQDPAVLGQKLAMLQGQVKETEAKLQEAAKIIETDKIKADADLAKEKMKQDAETARNKEDNVTAIRVAVIREAGQADRKEHDAGEADKDRAMGAIDADAADEHEREMQAGDQAHAAEMTLTGQEHDASMTERQAEIQAEQAQSEPAE